MKKHIIYIFMALIGAIGGVSAQESGSRAYFWVDSLSVERGTNAINLDAKISGELSDLSSQMMVEVTPMLVNGSDTVVFEARAWAGRKRYTALERQTAFEKQLSIRSGELTKFKRNSDVGYLLELTTEYEEWMSDAKFVLHEEVSGCRRWGGYEMNHEMGDPLLIRPSFQFALVEPPVEEIKLRSETYSAYINFEVSKFDLLPRYKNNPQILAEVDGIITEIQNDSNLTVTELLVTGYASPEGIYRSNMVLSENRAKAFTEYLKEKYGPALPSAVMSVSWKGEDWEGLRRQIEDSGEPYKEEVLRTLEEKDNMMRKDRLRQLSGGRAYADMLAKYYPALRRTEYTISYVSKPFDLEEAREVIKTKPQHLSLNEMYMVADSYPRDSREFEQTMDVVARFYPDDQVVLMNAAITTIQAGKYEQAVLKLQGAENPEAWNALGVAYYYMGEFPEAAEYFRKASAEGLEIAAMNNEALERSLKSEF